MDRFGEISLLCRLCLVKEQVKVPIFGVNGDIRQIFLKISSCLPVKVSETDPLPKNICEGCSDKLDLLYTFWHTSRDAEKTLLSWLQQAQVDNEISKQISVPVKVETDLTEEVIIKEDKDYTDVFSHRVFDNDETGAPPAKRARRTAAVKAQIRISQEESEGAPLTKVKAECVPVKEGTQVIINEDKDYTDVFSHIIFEDDNDETGAPPAKRAVKAQSSISQEESEEKEDDVDAVEPLTNVEDDSNMSDSECVLVKEETQLTGDVSINEDSVEDSSDETDAPPARRSAALKSQINLGQEESEEEEEEEEDDVEDESDMSDDDSTDDQPLSTRTSVDEGQAGPSGVGKEAADAPHNPELVFTCQQCPFRTTSSKALQKHMTTTHRYIQPKNEATSRYHCSQCDKGYPRRDRLILHIRRIHEKEENKFPCDICGVHLCDKSTLIKHKKQVHLKISVSCKLCDKTFVNRASLKAHMDRDHRKIFPFFQCEADGCQKTFKHSSNLKWHQNSVHLEKKTIFQCDQCDKSFTHYYSFKSHAQTHKPTESHACTICGKVFRNMARLQLHLRTHTGEKPFSCAHCDKSFITKSALKVHQVVHTKEKRFKCKVCGKGFTVNHSMKLHMKKFHPEEFQ